MNSKILMFGLLLGSNVLLALPTRPSVKGRPAPAPVAETRRRKFYLRLY